jgi:anti-sigma factor RsiW
MSERGFSCREVVELVTAYFDGALAEPDRAKFEAHVAGCDGCDAYLAQMRETIRITGTLTEDQVPEKPRAALVAAFRDWASG